MQALLNSKGLSFYIAVGKYLPAWRIFFYVLQYTAYLRSALEGG